jgi:GNAT superfamily N-acetyltransferase
MTDFQIRPMTADDIAPAVAMYRAGGWGERERFLRTVLSVDTCRPLVGLADGELVATGMATLDGEVGWVGSIFTRPDSRGRGYGRAMTEAACRLIDEAACRTQALIASSYGKPLYDSMGFRVDAQYEVYASPPRAAERTSSGAVCRVMRREDLPAVFALDARATAEDRSGLIGTLVEGAWVVEIDGRLQGYLASIIAGNAGLIAEGPEAATLLLDKLLAMGPAGEPVHVAIPVSNEAGRMTLASLGWRPAFQTPRMLRGDPIPWRPELIWSVLGFAFG